MWHHLTDVSMSVVTDILQLKYSIQAVMFFSVRSLHNEGNFSLANSWMAKCLPFLTPHTTMEHKHLPCIQRSWKVRPSQCIRVMKGLEWRISLTLRNDYGNNTIISPLSLSSFFLSPNPGCCEMGEDFSKYLRGNLWSREWTFSAPFSHSHSAVSHTSYMMEN